MRQVCLIFLCPKPCTRVGKHSPTEYICRSSVRVQSSGMAAEAEYSIMWVDMWKDGIAPGQASSTTVTTLNTKTWSRFSSSLQSQGLLAEIR